MIRTSKQLKDLVRNISKGDSAKAQIIIRNYIMERFLERISVSRYKDNFILKGGMLVSAMVGLDTRSTMDIDTTIKNLPLSVEIAKEILTEIISEPLEDGVLFKITNVSEIMDEAEYSGVRASLEASIDNMKTPFKLDISTGDVITPREVSYEFKLMFEDRIISVWAYNLETVLAEKLETVISRGTANTRLRDFYDLYILQEDDSHVIDSDAFRQAFKATCSNRESTKLVEDGTLIIREIRDNDVMRRLWKGYQKKFYYAADIPWDVIMTATEKLFLLAIS